MLHFLTFWNRTKALSILFFFSHNRRHLGIMESHVCMKFMEKGSLLMLILALLSYLIKEKNDRCHWVLARCCPIIPSLCGLLVTARLSKAAKQCTVPSGLMRPLLVWTAEETCLAVGESEGAARFRWPEILLEVCMEPIPPCPPDVASS